MNKLSKLFLSGINILMKIVTCFVLAAIALSWFVCVFILPIAIVIICIHIIQKII